MLIKTYLIKKEPPGLNNREAETGAPSMGDNLVVKVHYGLGSRNR